MLIYDQNTTHSIVKLEPNNKEDRCNGIRREKKNNYANAKKKISGILNDMHFEWVWFVYTFNMFMLFKYAAVKITWLNMKKSEIMCGESLTLSQSRSQMTSGFGSPTTSHTITNESPSTTSVEHGF